MRLALAVVFLSGSTVFAADWPQWRGPDRTNSSKESGLLTEWPQDGPPLAWKATGLGDGVAPVSVANGRVFTIGNVKDDSVCTALSLKNGQTLWTARIGPATKEMSVMRWLGQMAPTVDGERLYTVTSNGDYACLAADTGKVIWQKQFIEDFAGRKGAFGFCDYPLVDGDWLIICPGGDKNSVAALDKKTGRLVWGCPIAKERSAYSVLIVAEVENVRQYIIHFANALYGISTDGKVLWSYDGLRNGTANTHAPVIRGSEVFFANGYGTGHALLKIEKKEGGWTAGEVYKGRHSYVSWLGSPALLGDHIYINSGIGLCCRDWKTGQVTWEQRLNRCTYTVADGKLFIRDQRGKLILAEARPDQYKALSEFAPPRTDSRQPAWTFPVVANGKLFIRDYETLLCYDVRDPEKPRKKVPDAVFVPTPPDVVAKMLELAAVKKHDVLHDLGSGDGRIVIAAAKTHGCKAVGVELDKELVAKSRKRAQAAGVGNLVTFEEGDLFEADFSNATVVALYILPTMSQKLIPKFDKLKPGSRIVSHCFAIPGVKPDKVVRMISEEDDVERPIYLYTVPLRKEKK